jgi:hypothetical protein
MSLFSWRNLMSVCSYLGYNLFSTRTTLDGSLGDSRTVLLSVSSSWMDVLVVLASGMIESGWDMTKFFSILGVLQMPLVHRLSCSSPCHKRMRAWCIPLWRWEHVGLAYVDISYAAPQAHRIVNVALHQEYSPGIVFIFSQGKKDLYHV